MIVATARQAAELLAPCFAEENAAVAVLHLGSGQRLLATRLHPLEAGDRPALPVRAIVAAALESGAESVIVARAHSGGDPAPGEEDRAEGRLLADAAASAGIRLADIFIFAQGRCRSFRELKLL